MTQHGSDGMWTAANVELALARLAAYEDFHEAIQADLDKVTNDMERMKAAGRNETVSYRQLFARKLMLAEMLFKVGMHVQ